MSTRVGPRMLELLWILHVVHGGRAPSRAAAYMRLDYRGGSSNRYGDAVMSRLERGGYVRRDHDAAGNAVPVEITESGEIALRRGGMIL